MSKCLVLFSGGLDSITCLFWAIKNFGSNNIETITFDYRQKNDFEINSAKFITSQLNIPNSIYDIRMEDKVGNQSLLIPPMNDPYSCIPGRNIVFLMAAAAYAYKIGVNDIVAGICEGTQSGFPDCYDKTVRAVESTLSIGMNYRLAIHTPLMFLNKKETISLLIDLGCFDYLKHSHTCCEGLNPPCGKCPACILRQNGFDAAGIQDPLLSV